jgi:ABC-type Fe3+/spermidine/putrescine transport system ATPase subunit
MSHLDLHSVTKRFGAMTAVDDLSLTVEDGELVVLLGPSGCGKTTCLRLLAGFERPDDGTVELDGKVLAGAGRFVPPEKRGISVVFQTYALWPHLTVFDNVAYGLQVRKVGRSEIARRVGEILELVQLSGLSERAPHELSGGQQQRVAVARALITDPSTLLLDEPLSNLDTQLREEMRLEIKRLQRLLGVTTVYVTHDQAEALSLADRVVVMHAGRIAQQGSPEEVYRQPRDSYVATALGAANIVPVTVGGRDDDLVDVTSPCGMRLRALAPVDGTVPTDTGTIAIRPSDVELIADAEGRGTVRDRLFFGDSVQLTVDVEGLPDPLEVIAPPDTTAQPGARVRPTVRAGAAAVLAGPAPSSVATREREVGRLS